MAGLQKCMHHKNRKDYNRQITPSRKHPCAIAFVICSIQLERSFVPSNLTAKILISIIPITVIPKKIPEGREKISPFSVCIFAGLVTIPIMIRRKPAGIRILSCRFIQTISRFVAAIMIFHRTFPTPASVQRIEPVIKNGFL